MAKIKIEPLWKDVKPRLAYVYIHRRATDGTEFYVGKGNDTRGWSKNRGAEWRAIGSECGITIEIVQDGMTDDGAYLLESWLISKLTLEGIVLVNKKSGGGGPVLGGFKPVRNSNGQWFEGISMAVRWLRENGHPLASESKISVCCTGQHQRHSAYGCSWWFDGDEPKEYINANERRADQFGKPIITNLGEWFPSARSAAEWLRDNGWPNANDSKIASCRVSKRRTAYGRTWCNEGEVPDEFMEAHKVAGSRRWKPVTRSDGVVYESITAAAKALHEETGKPYSSCSSSVGSVARGDRGSAYGYTWRYL